MDRAIDELLEDYRKELGLTFGQVDAVRALHGAARVKKLAGMLRVGADHCCAYACQASRFSCGDQDLCGPLCIYACICTWCLAAQPACLHAASILTKYSPCSSFANALQEGELCDQGGPSQIAITCSSVDTRLTICCS